MTDSREARSAGERNDRAARSPAVTRSLLRLALAVGLLAVAAAAPRPVFAQGEDETRVARFLGVDLTRTDKLSLAQQKYAKTVADDLVCLCGTCPRESLATCDCGWASRGRKTVGLALLDGKTEQAVLDAFRKAYGDKVFATPPGSVEVVVTVIPYVLGILMLLAIIAFGLSNRRSPARVPISKASPAPTNEDEAARILRRELEELD